MFSTENPNVRRILQRDLGSIHARIILGIGNRNSERYSDDLTLTRFHLMFLAQTASKVSDRAVRSLTQNGLIVQQQTSNAYELTAKGKILYDLLKTQIEIYDWTTRKVLDVMKHT